MDKSGKVPATIDEYIESFPADRQPLLQTLRQTIQQAAPEAQEVIRYGMPTFRLNGTNLIYFAAYKNHIAVYPVTAAMDEALERLAPYRSGKGTARFPWDKPLPLDLVADMVRHRIAEIAT